MSPEKIRELLQLLGSKVPHAQRRNGWITCDCPLGPWRHETGKSSPEVFGIRRESGDPRANCFSCGWSGRLSELVLEHYVNNKTKKHVDTFNYVTANQIVEEAEATGELELDSPDIEEMLFGPKKKPAIYPDWWLDSFMRLSEAPKRFLDYAASRQIGPQIAALYDIRVDTKEDRICWPIRDFNGKLRGLHGRALEENVEPRYRMYPYAKQTNPLIWLGEHTVDFSRPIVVVEGPVDTTSVARVYRNVASPLYSNPQVEKLRRMADASEWITILDRGTGGNIGRDKITKTLSKDVIATHLEPPKGMKDPGAMSVEQLQELLSPYVKLDPVIY